MSDILNMEYLLYSLWKFFSPSMPRHGGVGVGRREGSSSHAYVLAPKLNPQSVCKAKAVMVTFLHHGT